MSIFITDLVYECIINIHFSIIFLIYLVSSLYKISAIVTNCLCLYFTECLAIRQIINLCLETVGKWYGFICLYTRVTVLCWEMAALVTE